MTHPAAGDGPRSGPLGESWRAWVALAVGVLAVSAHSALAYGMSPLLKPIVDELHWTRSEYATATNFRMLVLMLFAPFAGRLVDRVGARSVLTAGALLMGVGTLGLARMDSLAPLYGWSLLIGPGQACVGSVAGSALVLRLFRRRRGLAIGILNGGDNFITSGVHVASAALLADRGWRAALGALGCAYFALAALVFLALQPGEGRAEEGAARGPGEGGASPGRAATSVAAVRDPDSAWSDPRLWLLLVAYVPVYAFITSVGIHFPAYQRDLGRSAEQASYVYGLTTIVGAFGSVAWGWACERFSARAALVSVVAGLAITSLVLWNPVGESGWYAWAVVFGIVNAGAVALLALVLNEIFGSGSIGRLLGTAMVFCMAGTIAGNFLSAGLYDRHGSYLPVWRFYSALMVATLLPTLLLWRRRAVGDGIEAAS
ncbi:MAG: MFS transporter [Alphaproteobacteria bacterium]